MFLDAEHVAAVHSDGLDEVALVGVEPDLVEVGVSRLGDLTGQVLDDDGVDQVVQVVARGGKLHAYRDLLACRPDQAGGQLAGGKVPSIAQLAPSSDSASAMNVCPSMVTCVPRGTLGIEPK